MVDAKESSFLERVEEQALDEAGLSHWLFFVTLIVLPWLLGMACVAYVDSVYGPMSVGFYVTVTLIQCVVSVIAIPFAIVGPRNFFLFRLLGSSDSLEAKPGNFQLGLAFFMIHRNWLKYPIIAGLFVVLVYLKIIVWHNVVEGEVEKMYWLLSTSVGWFFAFLGGGFDSLCCLIGLFVRRRLQERGR